MFSLGVKGYIYIAIFLVVTGTITAGYFYVTNLQEDNAELREEMVKKEIIIETQKTNINLLKNTLQMTAKREEVLNENYAGIREEIEETRKLFANHDIKKIAKKKPTLLERKMRNATAKKFAEIEEITKQ